MRRLFFMLVAGVLLNGLDLPPAFGCGPKMQIRRKDRVILDVPRLIRSNGYPAERHSVVTEDGYVLEVHRIPRGREGCGTSKDRARQRPIVLLVHCLLCTSSIWVMQGTKDGLGYLLADAGYDVWMLNTRGTTSSNHLKLSRKNPKFWKFSWHEKGVYDVPAVMDYALAVTNQTTLTYIGYSMGTTIYFAMSSSKPNYKKKISMAVAIAPAVFVSGAKGLLADLCSDINTLEYVLKSGGEWIFPPPSYNLRDLLQSLCDYSNLFMRPVCASILDLLVGVSMKNINWKKMAYFFHYFPDYTSVNTVLHFCQIKNSGLFRAYDYGEEGNLNTYDWYLPPLYNLSSIETPVHLLFSMYDTLTRAKGVFPLLSMLPNAFGHPIDVPQFSHAHFCWGSGARKIVYENILKILEKSS